jgi:hypothetical protein
MADDLAKLRAELNLGAIDTPNFIKAIQAAYQNMPGAGVAQAGLAAGSDLLGGLAGNLYGVGKQALSGQLGNLQAGNQAYADAQKVAQALHYNPPTQAGQDIYNAYNAVGEATGPLPELWNTPMRFTPDDLRVAGRTVTQDIRNFPSDYANAQAGITREYPTLGSRAAGAAETAKPFIEPIYNQVMETGGFNIPGMPNQFSVPVASYAVKPKGGNWPTNLGNTNRLSEQGEFGMHLADTQISDPAAKWFEYLPRQVRWDWERYVDKLMSEHGNLTPPQKQAYAEEFTKEQNAKREAQGQPLITPPSEFERVAPQYNSWVMGPYQKYITNQMGTGLSSDPLVQAFNETNMPVNEFTKLINAPDYQPESDISRAESRRRDFAKELTRYGIYPEILEEPQNVNVGKQTATSPAGIAIENALDATLYPKGSYAFRPEEGYLHVSKLPLTTVINDFINSAVNETTGLPSIQKKVLQDLIAGNLDVNKLSNLTPAVVARQLIKDEQARQKALQSDKDMAESYRIARNKELPTDMTYPDGSKMVVFTKADYDKDPLMLTRDLSQITKDLHQCIGSGCHGTDEYPKHGPVLEPHTGKPPKGSAGTFKYHSYFEGLEKGTREIASLKDPQGVSQFTANIMVRGNNLQGTPTYHKNFVKNWILDNLVTNDETFNNWKPIVDNINKEGDAYFRAVLESTPELKNAFNEHFKPQLEKSITEMKGYDNGEIKPEYILYVKEWLNQHSDFDRVDMDKLEGEIFDLKNVHSANNLLESKHDDWSSVAIENLLIDARDNNLLPRFFDDKDFEKLAGDRQVDLTEDPINTGSGLSPVAQRAYEGVSQQIVDTFEDAYVREAFSNGDNPALNAIIREIQERPNGYGLGNYSPAVRSQVILALRNEAQRNGNLNQMADEIQGMEPENANEFQPARLNETDRTALNEVMNTYLEHGLRVDNLREPLRTDARILEGNQADEARLPEQYHRDIIDALINQDDHVGSIRYIIDTLQGPGYFPAIPELTTPQLENILNIVISWTERYPLAE